MKTFRSRDFLWETTDIAIWSTVEQGLAITAGSLATIRPLFTIVLVKLGLSTQPTNRQTPYGYQTSSFGHSRRRPSAGNELDLYKISGDAERGTVKFAKSNLEIPEGDDASIPKSPTWYQSPFQKIKRSSCRITHTKKEGDTDSEKSLRMKSEKDGDSGFNPTQSYSDDRSMQIMVERSFFVTDAERKSYVDQDLKR